MKGPLVTTDQLLEWSRENPEGLAIIDCRYDLQDHLLGFFAYRESHIPGAVYCQLNQDLAAKPGEQTGRHPLPSLDELEHAMGKLGVTMEKKVVVYDDKGGAFAGRLWWVLRYLGHPQVYLLDGGIPKWIAEEKPLKEGIEEGKGHVFKSFPRQSLLVTKEEILEKLQSPLMLLVDARAPERYKGEVEPIDPVAGHIPGAKNLFYQWNLDEHGCFRPKEELLELYSSVIGEVEPSQVVFYCGSGVTSCLNLIAMEYLELYGARLYVGSWSEWCRTPHLPKVFKE
ncbi:MAG: sulfurtransferase, partial [Planctomycetota bacterium]